MAESDWGAGVRAGVDTPVAVDGAVAVGAALDVAVDMAWGWDVGFAVAMGADASVGAATGAAWVTVAGEVVSGPPQAAKSKAANIRLTIMYNDFLVFIIIPFFL